MAYLLDANVFMAAYNLHYGMDFCPAFWEWLVREHEAGKVFSVEMVGNEIRGRDDELAAWAGQRGDAFFLVPDQQAITALGSVAAWVNTHPTYSPAAKNTFLQIADYYLVAQALAGRHVVVTHEKPENSVHRVKIPSACLGVSVRFMTPFEMLRRERARFVLGPPQQNSWVTFRPTRLLGRRSAAGDTANPTLGRSVEGASILSAGLAPVSFRSPARGKKPQDGAWGNLRSRFPQISTHEFCRRAVLGGPRS